MSKRCFVEKSKNSKSVPENLNDKKSKREQKLHESTESKKIYKNETTHNSTKAATQCLKTPVALANKSDEKKKEIKIKDTISAPGTSASVNQISKTATNTKNMNKGSKPNTEPQDPLSYSLADITKKLTIYHQLFGIQKTSNDQTSTSLQAQVDSKSSSTSSATQVDQVQNEVKKYQELANKLLNEINILYSDHIKTLKMLELLKLQLTHIPTAAVLESKEYKKLQASHISLQYICLHNKASLIELRIELMDEKYHQFCRMDNMEHKELMMQKDARVKIIKLEDRISQIRQEYLTMNIKFAENLSLNKETAPINHELRHLIKSLYEHNERLKYQLKCYKERAASCSEEKAHIGRKIFVEKMRFLIESQSQKAMNSSTDGEVEIVDETNANVTPEEAEKNELIADFLQMLADYEKQQEEEGESENQPATAPQYNENQQINFSEEVPLLNEISVTSLALEDLQDQNADLLQKLCEKDDIHLKLVSEQAQESLQIQLLHEEKRVLKADISDQEIRMKQTNVVLEKQKEKLEKLQNTVTVMQKERSLDKEAIKLYEQQMAKTENIAANYESKLTHCDAQLKEKLQEIEENIGEAVVETYKANRLSEMTKRVERRTKLEIEKRKEEQSKKTEILAEYCEYVELVLCSLCKEQKKDAIISKCYHVFCFNCLQTRYAAGQRCCPKCNCDFDAKDIQRIHFAD